MANPALLKAVFDNSLDGIIYIDQKSNIKLVNPGLCVLFGFQADELIGKNVNSIMNWYSKKDLLASFGKGREVNGIKKDGCIFPVRLTVNEVLTSSRVLYAAMVHDLSQEKKVEASLIREKELNQLKTRLVSVAAHEFRSPLSRIQLSASLIERYYLRLNQDKIMEHLQKIKNAVEDMTATLNDFLSIERIEAGNVKPDFREFDLIFFAEGVTEEMKLQQKSNQQIVYRHEGEENLMVLDRNMLKHCLVNLLSNAIKYSDDNGLIHFDTMIDAMHCKIKIQDFGMGLPNRNSNIYSKHFIGLPMQLMFLVQA